MTWRCGLEELQHDRRGLISTRHANCGRLSLFSTASSSHVMLVKVGADASCITRIRVHAYTYQICHRLYGTVMTAALHNSRRFRYHGQPTHILGEKSGIIIKALGGLQDNDSCLPDHHSLRPLQEQSLDRGGHVLNDMLRGSILVKSECFWERTSSAKSIFGTKPTEFHVSLMSGFAQSCPRPELLRMPQRIARCM